MTESLIEEEQIEVLEHAMDRTKQNQNWINQILAPNALSTVMNHRQTLLAWFSFVAFVRVCLFVCFLF